MARTSDGTLTSANTDMCFFRVDRTPPTAAVTSTDFPASGTIGAHPKRVGEEGTFTLTGTDPAPAAEARTSGLACARWTTDPVEAAATGWKCTDPGPGITKLTGGEATITIKPPRWGTNFVYLQTQDNAGNVSQPFVYSYYAPSDPSGTVPVFGDLTGDMNADILLPDTAGALRVIGGGSDPAAAPKAGISSAPGSNGWNGIQISHRGSLGYKTVDDLFAHAPAGRDLSLYRNDGIAGRFDSRAAETVLKPTACLTPSRLPIPCGGSGYGPDWSNVTQIAAFGNHAGDSSTKPNSVPRTSLLFVEKGRLWLAAAGDPDQLEAGAVLLSDNDTRWDSYELITPGRAQGTDFPTLWARSKSDGTVRVFTVKGTAQAPDLTGFTDPAAGTVVGKIDPTTYPRIGSEGDLTGDGIPDLWAVDANRQLVAFNGIGTRADGGSVPHPTVTGFESTPVTLGNLNMPKAQWPLTGQKDDGTTPSTVGKFPATATGVTWPTATIGGRGTTYAAFNGPSSAISTPGVVIDTRKSFTISTAAMATTAGGVVLSQGPKGSTSLLLFPNHRSNTWEFALANPNAAGWPYDTTVQTNSAAGITFNTWTQLTAVYDHTTGQMRLYVNGTLAGTGHHNASAGPAPTGPLTLGRFEEGDASSGLTGGISNPAVYSYAASVTATEVASPISLTAATGHCLDNDGNSADDGNRIQIAGCNGTDAQKFQVRDDGTIRTHGACLNASAAGTANTTPIELRACDGSAPSQKFLPRADGTIYNPVSGRCLDLGNADTTPGRQLWLWDCSASAAQRWSVPALGTAPLPVPVP